MAQVQYTVYQVTIDDHFVSYDLMGASLYQDIKEQKSLAEIQASVANLIDFYEMRGQEAMVSVRIKKGRAPAGFRAWDQNMHVTKRALPQAA